MGCGCWEGPEEGKVCRNEHVCLGLEIRNFNTRVQAI